MTIPENEKLDLINYRLDQAHEAADDAGYLLSSNRIPAAVNRIYYAVFYCLLAFALKYNYETSKHLQLIGWFNKNFVAKKTVSTKFGKIVRNCYEYRRSADYDSFVNFNIVDVQVLFDEMKSFINMTRDFLNIKR